MPVPAAIVALWHATVTLTLRSTTDAYSAPVAGTSTAVRARVVYGNHRTTNVKGEEIVSTVTTIYCEDVPGFGPEGSVTLPDGTSPKIHNVHRVSWPDDSSHLEISA